MRRKRLIQTVLGLPLASYLVLGTYFWATQENKIFKPLGRIAQTPADLDPPLKYEPVKIPTEQSAVHGYWLPTEGDAPVVIYLHGQDATIGKNLHHAECLNQLGCGVLVIDYRGYGVTFGSMTPTESSVCHDAEIAWNYLTMTRGIAPERILIYGHSLGGAIAIELATHHPEAGGLIAESSFTSVKRMARWKFPVTYLLPLDLLLRHQFNSLDKVRSNELPPVLFIHGTADSKIPSSMCLELFEAALGPEKEMVLLSGGEHAYRREGQTTYRERVSEFIDRYFGPHSVRGITK